MPALAKKNRKRKRRSTDKEEEQLPEDRFSSLAALLDEEELPSMDSEQSSVDSEQSSVDSEQSSVDSAQSSVDSAQSRPSSPYSISKTRKGGYHVSIHKLPGNRVKTVLAKVDGDGKLLLKRLKRALGTGGSYKDGRIELQGDQQSALESLLDTMVGEETQDD